MISVSKALGDVAVLRLEGAKLGARGFESGLKAIEGALGTGATAILLDVAAAKTLRASDLGRLVELAAMALPQARLSLVNVAPPLITALRERSLDQVVSAYATIERALEAPEIKSALLAKTPAVVLSAGKGSRMAPLTQMRPKPMLDIMGRPVLEHILRHLGRFGIRDIVLNPGHLGPQIPAHFAAGHATRQSIQYLNEGYRRNGRWIATPQGSASTLARWVQDHNGLMTDTIVMCGDALIDLDFAAMMAAHRASDADVTIAVQSVSPSAVENYGILVADEAGRVNHFQEKPAQHEAKSTLANTGVYILSPRVAAELTDRDGADIGGDLLPRLLAKGARLRTFAAPFQWVDIGNGRDYMAAWKAVLAGDVPHLLHEAVELKPGIWAHPSAEVARLSDIDGPAFLGARTVVARGASLRGPVVLCEGTTVAGGAFLRDSVIMPDTQVGNGAWVDGIIASPLWAIKHAYADGSDQPWAPLEGLTPVGGAGRPIWAAPAEDELASASHGPLLVQAS